MRAIIIKKQNTGEYDQFITCYTEEAGKFTAIAKSILKPSSIQAMHLDVMNLVNFDLVEGRAMSIITGAQVEKVYIGIKSDLGRLSAGYFFVEAINKIAFDYQEDRELWEFITSTLQDLNNGPDNLKEYIRSNQERFLSILGYTPNFEECAFCAGQVSGANSIVYSPEARGAVCQDCFLEGRRGVVLKSDHNSSDPNDQLTIPVLGAIFESLAERRLYSLSMIK